MAKSKHGVGKKGKKKERPEFFQTFAECVKWNKKSVYLIVRGRKLKIDGKEGIKWITLGSGFLAAPNRFVTASHVINNPNDKNFGQHCEGDIYYLLHHDDENKFHIHSRSFNLDKDLFLYPNIDLAILYLDEGFYNARGKTLVDINNYIPISKEFLSIGSEIGILGYPISGLQFADNDFNKPLIGNIIMRTDMGVVNCRYQTSEQVYAYEFTLAFNPGNSGGPIFNARSGRVISVVKGFNNLMISQKNNIESENDKNGATSTGHAHVTYSSGFATPTFLEVFKNHKIIK